MRKSKTLEKLRNGEWVLSTAVAVGGARVAELAGQIGFDCLWIYTEHKPIGDEALFNTILGARAGGSDCLVRIRKRGYLDYFRALEDGAAGIMVPHVKSAEEAREIVRNAKYVPLGRRGIDFAGADSRYMLDNPKENMVFANRETFITVQIEDPEALEVIDEIASVEGIDLLFVGPGDLGAGLGSFGNKNSDVMQAAIKKVADAAEKHGKWWGLPVGSVEEAQKYLDMGARFLNYSSDLGAVVREFNRTFKEFGAIKPNK